MKDWKDEFYKLLYETRNIEEEHKKQDKTAKKKKRILSTEETLEVLSDGADFLSFRRCYIKGYEYEGRTYVVVRGLRSYEQKKMNDFEMETKKTRRNKLQATNLEEEKK